MDLKNLFGRKVLEAYLAVVVVILTAVAYIILAGIGFQQDSGMVMLSILVIILIGVNILSAVVELRMLEKLKEN
ncbi:MAG: hypothetical protein SVS85_01960 [Candidatus Nanohaloarchaea archaeon]|nr:hypothetical protein [Candidatus Nanohaloarchaea archaeon]